MQLSHPKVAKLGAFRPQVCHWALTVFVTASYQTGLGTRSMTQKPIIEGI